MALEGKRGPEGREGQQLHPSVETTVEMESLGIPAGLHGAANKAQTAPMDQLLWRPSRPRILRSFHSERMVRLSVADAA